MAGPGLIWCHKKKSGGETQQREDGVKTQAEVSHLSTGRGEKPQEEPVGQHLDLRPPAARIIGKYISVAQATCLGYLPAAPWNEACVC